MALIYEQSAIKQLVIANEDITLALTKLYNGTATTISQLKQKLSDVAYLSKQALSETLDKLNVEQASELDKDQKQFIGIVNQYSYSELREIRAFVPEGMNVTYLEILSKLDEPIKYLASFDKNVLSEYELFLGKLVSDRKSLLDLNTNASVYKSMESNRDKIYKSLGDCYKVNSYESNTTIKAVVERNSDWSSVLHNLNSHLSILSKIDRKAIQDKVMRCEGYLDSIINMLDSEEDLNISPEVIKYLASGSYQIAKELEFFASTYFRVLTLKGSISNTMDQVVKIYK